MVPLVLSACLLFFPACMFCVYPAGTCYFVPVFGGWIADSMIGRFNTILGSALIYVVGEYTKTNGHTDRYRQTNR